MPVAPLLLRVLAFLLAAGLADGQDAQPAQPERQPEPLKAEDIMASRGG